MKILIVEDDESRIKKFKQELVGHDVTIVTTSAEAIEYLAANAGEESSKFDLMFLDHDLGGEQMVESNGSTDTGWKVANFLLKQPIVMCPAHVIIHSMNPAGADNIRSILHHAVCIPFCRLDISGAASRINNFIHRNEQ